MNLFIKTKDFSVSQEEFNLMYDDKNDMLVTKPQPSHLAKYYESDDYISHTDSKKTLVDKIYHSVKNYSLQKKIKLAEKYVEGSKSIMDVGAGTGDFLITAKKKGWKINGVEPNTSARKLAEQKGLSLFDDLQNVNNQKFDVITLWHVLEHLPDLDNQIKKLKSLLKDNGTLILAVPNYKSYDAKFYKAHWAAFDVPRHLWHFSKKSISVIFGAHQMKVIKTKPMLFDAFYVSLLSEKYKTGKQHLIKAFYRGLCSNIAALSTKEHSSIIYIIKNA